MAERAPLGILLVSGEAARAHAALMLAATAAALGRRVVVFASADGVAHLAGPDAATAFDARADGRGVAGIAVLRESLAAMGVRLIACESALRLAGIAEDQVLAGVEIAGMATLLEAIGDGMLTAI